MQRSQSGIGDPTMLKRYSRGSSLPELLLAMVFGSMIMLAAMQLYPTLRQQSQHTLQRFQLEHLLDQVAFTLEKDLRRAGFCDDTCTGQVITLGQFTGEAANSCIIIAYDFDRRGGAPRSRETFGYRLRAGALETQVAIQDCLSGGWQRLLDLDAIRVTTFRVVTRQHAAGSSLYEVRLAGYLRQRPAIQQQIVRWIAGRNA